MARSSKARYVLVTLVFAALVGGCADATSVSVPSTSLAVVTTLPPMEMPTTTTTLVTVSTTVPPPAPTLVTTPARGDVVTTYKTQMEISTEPGVVLTVGETELPVGDTGVVTVDLLNVPGDNLIRIVAAKDGGVFATRQVTFEFVPAAGWAVAIGDSVMLGSKTEIEKRIPGVAVNATVSRQFSAAPAMVRELVQRPVPPELIIIGLGTNGPARESDLYAIMEAARDIPRVVFVNVRVPRTWEGTSNSVIADGVARYDNAVLVDWYAVSSNRNELFAADGVHPKQPGRVILADLIEQAVFGFADTNSGVEDA